MLEQVKHVIFSSTAAVYEYTKYLPVNEEHTLDPINYFTKSIIAVLVSHQN